MNIYRIFLLSMIMMSFGASANEMWTAKTIVVKGKVLAVDKDGQSRQLAINSKIQIGEKVISSAGSLVQLFLTDGTLITLTDVAEMTIRKYSQDYKDVGVELEILKGAYRICAGAIAEKNPEKFKLLTPDGEFIFNSGAVNGKKTKLFLVGKVEEPEYRVIALDPHEGLINQ